jgi:septal ring factor EnvC (AmiA/AmiB activator)
MDDAAATQTRERVTRWIEESRDVFGLLQELLENDQRLSAKSDQSERDSERLRKELADLRKEVAELRDEREHGKSAHGDLQQQIEEMRKENEQLRSEKDEAAQAFARLIETVQSTNQIAQKLGVTKSPFAKHAPAATPNPAPHD